MSLFLVSFFYAFHSGFALNADQIREQIKAQMAERHPNPEVGAFWDKLGSDAIPVLKQMLSQATSSYEKSWLIDGLSHFDDPSVGSLLQEQIQGTNNAVLKKKLLGALVQSQGENAYDFVEPYLKDEDEHIRLTVAKMLKKYAFEKSKERLVQFQANEKVSWVKDELQKEEAKSSDKMKRKESIYQRASKPDEVKKALAEKKWVGIWNGFYLKGDVSVQAALDLTLIDEKVKTSAQKWKVQIKLPKQKKFDFKENDFEVAYFQTVKLHWLEVRNKKDDAVFLGSKKEE